MQALPHRCRVRSTKNNKPNFEKKNSNEPKNLKIKDNHVEIILWMTFILNFF